MKPTDLDSKLILFSLFNIERNDRIRLSILSVDLRCLIFILL